MPTYKPTVFKHHQRRDGKFRVSIRITHNRKSVYMPTDVYVSRKQITTDFKTIKDTEVVRMIDRDIIEYENILFAEPRFEPLAIHGPRVGGLYRKVHDDGRRCGHRLHCLCEGHIKALRAEGRNGTAGRFEAVIRNLTDYFGRSTVFVKEINVKNLQGFVSICRNRTSRHERTSTEKR